MFVAASLCVPTLIMRVPAALNRRAALSAALSTFAVLGPHGPAHSISATTMTGKTKADLGVVLVEAPKQVGKSLSADVVLDGGLIATATFETPWTLAEGGYADFEASTRDGEAAYLQVVSLGKGESLESVPKSWFSGALFSVDGRYGAYGAPTDVKLKELEKENGARTFDLSFTVLSPSMAELPRKGVVRALQAPGSPDVLLLTCSSGASRWAKANSEADARKAVSTFKIASTRPTALKRDGPSDFRYGKTSGPEGMRSRNDGF